MGNNRHEAIHSSVIAFLTSQLGPLYFQSGPTDLVGWTWVVPGILVDWECKALTKLVMLASSYFLYFQIDKTYV